MGDRELLEKVARDLEDLDGTAEEVAALREIAARVDQPPKIEVVEQMSAMKTAGAAPDGWSWTDLNDSKAFTGYYSGIKAQRGEPIIEQDGHCLLLRQGEVSYSDRQIPIYERLSSLEGLDVIVVNGFLGARRNIIPFIGGEMLGVRDPGELSATVRSWLEQAHANPIPGWERKQKRTPPMDKLPL